MATIKINSVDIISSWSYKCKNNKCVCGKSLQLPALKTDNNNFLNRNDIVFTKCNHGMHKSCMDENIKKGNNICPFDQLPILENEIKIMKNDKYYITS